MGKRLGVIAGVVAALAMGALGLSMSAGWGPGGPGPGPGGVVVGGNRTRSGSTPAGTIGAPNTPTGINTIVVDTSTVIIFSNAFVGSGADTQDSLNVQLFRVANNMSGAAMLDLKQGVFVRDTFVSNDSLKADTTYKARMRHKGTAGGWSAWSAPDTFINATSFVPDLTALANVSAAIADTAVYNALNVDGQESGYMYNDPESGLLVVKVTDAVGSAFPATCSGGWGNSYFNGPTRVSHAWTRNDSTFHTLIAYCISGNSNYLIDYAYGGVLKSARAAPVGGEMSMTFSNNPATPRTLYFIRGDSLHEYNTETSAEVTAGDFPVPFGADSWLQSNALDTRFAGIIDAASDSAIVFFRSDSSVKRQRSTNFNEPYLEKNGNFVLMQRGGSGTNTQHIWAVVPDTIATYVQDNASKDLYHGSSIYGRWVARGDFSGTEFHGVTSAGVWASYESLAVGGCAYGGTTNGSWLQGTVAEDQQWFLSHNRDGSFSSNCSDGQAIALVHVGGSVPKFVVHHYHDLDGTENAYFKLGYSVQSADGLLVSFQSDMAASGSDPYTDLFIAELPRTPGP